MSTPIFKEKQDQPVIRVVCPQCNKVVGRPGSMTSWMFAATNCRCAVSSELQAALAPAESQHAEKNIESVKKSELFGTRYSITSVAGYGAMGTVYSVYDTQLDAEFAIKVLHDDLAKNRDASDRFQHEAAAVKELTHANIVTVFDQGVTDSGLPFIVMELIEGQSLEDLLAKGTRLDLNRALDIFVQVCEALEYAHSCGVVHRDLKPSNIMIKRSPEGHDIVKVVDFGIAKVKRVGDRRTINLTQTGDVFGSPSYMSPEQCLGLEVDARSDLYSLGCMMFECITGHTPFTGDNPIQIVAQHIGDKLPSLGDWRLGIPSGVDMVIRACLSKDVAQRYPNASALKTDLQLLAEGKEPIRGIIGWQPSWLLRRGAALCIDASVLLILTFLTMNIFWTIVTFLYWGPGGSINSFCFQISTMPEFFVTNWANFLCDCAFAQDPLRLLLAIAQSASAAVHASLGKNLPVEELLALTFGAKAVVGIIWAFFTLICNWLYHAILQSSKHQNTIGERLMGMKLVDSSGGRIEFGRATFRHFLKFFNLLIVFDLARFLMALKRSKSIKNAAKQILQQPIHDKLSGTFLIKQGESAMFPFSSKGAK